MAIKSIKADLYKADRDKGMTYTEIAKKYGVSHQAVAQACARRGGKRFKPYTSEEVVYPNLRKWLNEKEITRKEFAREIGRLPNATASTQINHWFRGRNYPNKQSIDKILKITGFTYEVLFAKEG